eukprot:TRINITY_DN30925_c0_g1_i1.p1 TRINITY_DN30925_c0_g1~~TRINITY_DN30925_c0_g1_i1.p1  ORF type:complete len:455 (+),score=46.77 TRINITY_DN30925_c0_g1_i1:53-1417(+)
MRRCAVGTYSVSGSCTAGGLSIEDDDSAAISGGAVISVAQNAHQIDKFPRGGADRVNHQTLRNQSSRHWRVFVVLLIVAIFVLAFMVFGLYSAVPSPKEPSDLGGSIFVPAAQRIAAKRLRGTFAEAFADATTKTDESESLGELSSLPSSSARLRAAGDGIDRIRGAQPDLQSRYLQSRATGRFQCFDGTQELSSFKSVNDDFCDCPDGSDEPGTSACAGLVPSKPGGPPPIAFACAWAFADATSQVTERGAFKMVRSAAVNDGICDCCGGEDEWDTTGGAAVCPDRCAQEENEQAAEVSRRVAGSLARSDYVKRGRKLRWDKNRQPFDGGPDGVYLVVAADGCLNFNDGDYSYVVCPFVKVTQTDKQKQTFTLGKGVGKWASTLWETGEQRVDYSKVTMSEGDYCYAAHSGRRAELHFECAEKPAIVSVQETQVCVYAFRVDTPAACQPLDHA